MLFDPSALRGGSSLSCEQDRRSVENVAARPSGTNQGVCGAWGVGHAEKSDSHPITRNSDLAGKFGALFRGCILVLFDILAF